MNLSTPLPAAAAPDHRVRIIRVPQGPPYQCRVAATRAATCWTHYTNFRTLPCADDESCAACAAGLNRKFEAYLAVQRVQTGERVILALPEGAWRQLELLLGPAVDGKMWGHHLEFVREGGKRGKLEVFDGGPRRPEETCPRPVNTPVVLKRAWTGGHPPWSPASM